MKPRAFQLHLRDNVATLIETTPAGTVECFGAVGVRQIVTREPIARGHKVALSDLSPGEAVVKCGVCIGHATQAIECGRWVHLHNLASDLDQRSGSLDLYSGVSSEIPYV